MLKRFATSTAVIAALALPVGAFAQGATSYYIVQDVKTKKCTIVDKKPVRDRSDHRRPRRRRLQDQDRGRNRDENRQGLHHLVTFQLRTAKPAPRLPSAPVSLRPSGPRPSGARSTGINVNRRLDASVRFCLVRGSISPVKFTPVSAG